MVQHHFQHDLHTKTLNLLSTFVVKIAHSIFYLKFHCNSAVNIPVVYHLVIYLLDTYISLLYTYSNLLTVNMIALNTVPPGTGE